MAIFRDIYDNLTQYDYEKLLRYALERVPDSVNKREGSVIFNALSPLSMLMSMAFEVLHEICMESRFQTATADYLDLAGAQHGIYRLPATYARWRAKILPHDLIVHIRNETTEGQKFKSVEGLGLIYEAVENLGNGLYLLECKEDGELSNYDHGTLQAIPLISSTSCDLITCETSGTEKESDAQYRHRIWAHFNKFYYGGNFYDYLRWIFEDFTEKKKSAKIDGLQIYPAWQGGGTVKIVVTSADTGGEAYHMCSQAIIDDLQRYLDPYSDDSEKKTGAGVVPIGHHVTVSTIVRYGMGLDVHIQCKAGYTVDEEMKINILRAIRAYLTKIRGEGLSKIDSKFPYLGYQVQFFISALHASIQQSDYDRIAGVNVFRRENNGEYHDNPQLDFTLVSDSQSQPLPYLDQLKIDGIMFFEE